MPIPNLTDKEKIYKWNDLCVTYGWVAIGEVEAFLKVAEVKFTPSGSVLIPLKMSVVATNQESVNTMTKECSIKALARYVVNIYCANVVFSSVALEVSFWKNIIERLDAEFDVFLEPELVPSYIRTILKYPSENGEVAT